MPGEVITIAADKYPELAKIDDGEQVDLKVSGTKGTDQNGDIEITTTAIVQTNVNPAKKSLKTMKKGAGYGANEKETAAEDAAAGEEAE